eukprot:CAMPEP_0194203266 /NCGR_PEP_ID=MMETSP0156-20130528/3091_1 /TAXON_ID=33649 /ORGANISM="Thalassionema nitzschioides, Strain L26-B" /LENGTH=209 /DNA_ID=CAMNT_0038928977 /DNA_START=73 /DNA_END=702 /DNA_ORIENTATION=-
MVNGVVGFSSHYGRVPSSTTSLNLFGKASSAASSSSSASTNEALELYQNKYSSGSRQKFFFESWGMPSRAYSAEEKDKKLFTTNESELRQTFNELSKLYGESEALTMVKIQPGILAFSKDNFKPSLEVFAEKFGLEEAKQMVLRNPGLLSTKPWATIDNLTMQLSYIVAITRPLGVAGPFLLLALASVPALEGYTGVSKEEFFNSIFGG